MTPWKSSLLLTREQKENLDELATRIRRKADYRPGASELVRAAVDAAIAKLRDEPFDDLVRAVGALPPRQASRVIEQWIVDRLGR